MVVGVVIVSLSDGALGKVVLLLGVSDLGLIGGALGGDDVLVVTRHCCDFGGLRMLNAQQSCGKQGLDFSSWRRGSRLAARETGLRQGA